MNRPRLSLAEPFFVVPASGSAPEMRVNLPGRSPRINPDGKRGMVLKKVLHLLRTRQERRNGAWASWVGRNWAHWTYAVRVEPTWLEVNQIDISIASLPESFAGFKIVQMSDFHGGRHVTSAYLDEAVALAQEQAGDIVVLTGDFIHKGNCHIDRVATSLGRLRAPHGVFAVLGNHDFSVRNALGFRRYRDLHRHVGDALAAQGIYVLRNEAVPLRRGDDVIYLTGMEDLWSRMCDPEASFAGVPSDRPRIVLAHNPLTIEKLANERCDLMLSGHTHGGQVMVPGLGRLALGPGGRRFSAGLYRVGHAWLYVNKGIGFGLPIRYRVRPEVAVFSLK
jgi:predicted MPP superfamily phosphohydrolase